MKLLYRLLKQDPESREGIITVTGVLGVIVNLLVGVAKVITGLVASSMAILSEGINSSMDALTSVLTLVGTKLSTRHPDAKHPFGYGRIEYLTGMLVSMIILYSGVQVLISSVKLIFNPEPVNISVLSLIIVAVTAGIKLILGLYTIRMGKKADSSALTAVGLEGRNDCVSSLITIVTAVIFLVFHVNLDAYAGVITSLLILKAGGEVLWSTLSELIGRPGEKELADTLYREIRAVPGILNAADMMLHNYGPESWSGSVNVEIDQKKNVAEVYRMLHEVQLRIMHEHHVTMVFGVYAVDNDSVESKALRTKIAEFVRTHEGVKSYHALYFDEKENCLYCDLIVDYSLKDWNQVKTEFKTMIAQFCGSDMKTELTVETEYV